MAITQLWLPIIAAAVFVFIASSLVHMVFKWHQPDYKALKNEEDVRKTLSAGELTPGIYVTPYCGDMKDMGSEKVQQQYRDGPVAFITVIAPGVPKMGKSLGQWFLLNLAIATLGALLALQAFGVTANPRQAAHLVGIFTMIAYGCGSIQDSIWMGRTWSSTLKYLLDAFIYGAVSALSFNFLWP